MAVVFDQTGRRVILLGARAPYGRWRRIGRRASAASEHRAGAKQQRCEDPRQLLVTGISLMTLTFSDPAQATRMPSVALPVLADAVLLAHADAHGAAVAGTGRGRSGR